MKNLSSIKDHRMFLVMLLLSCTIFLASCGESTAANSSSALAGKQAPIITPIGAQAVCLTIHTPSLLKLADGNYKLGDEIDNCGGKNADALQVTLHINAQTINLLGPGTIIAKGKATYSTFSSPTAETSKELHLISRSSSSAVITIFATINHSMQGEWDGEITIPA